MTRTHIRFPRLYAALTRNLQVDFQPSHFLDLTILGLIGLAFVVSVVTMGNISQGTAGMTPALVAAAAALHAFAQIDRSDKGVRFRWAGALLLPLAIWMIVDSAFLTPTAWRGREQAAVALTAAVAFWVTVHHLRHIALRWCLIAGMALVASSFGALVLSSGHNILPRLAQRSVAPLYDGQATGPFATPGEFGAFLMLCLFPAAAVFVSPALRPRRRVAAGYATLLGIAGLWATHHSASLYGALAGGAILALFLMRSRRKACIVGAVLFGLAFYVPKISRLDAGLFRVDAGQSPLSGAAGSMIAAHPVTGVGGGAFPNAFEAFRPTGWDLDPLTAGGFFHQLLAENGLIGFLLIVPFGVLLWVLLFRAGLKAPVRLTRYDPQFNTKRTYVPEIRFLSAGILAGTLGATITLALDYAHPSTALAMTFAILAAIVTRELIADRGVQTILPVAKPNMTVRTALATTLILVFCLFTYPVFESARFARRAEDILKQVEANDVKGSAMIIRGNKLIALTEGEKAGIEALRLVPDNARAEAALSGLYASQFRLSGKNEKLGECLALARSAALHSAEDPRLCLPLIAAYRIHGDEAAADKLIADLRRRSPNLAPIAVEEARSYIARGRPEKARPILEELARTEPWNSEVRRLRKIVDIAPQPSDS